MTATMPAPATPAPETAQSPQAAAVPVAQTAPAPAAPADTAAAATTAPTSPDAAPATPAPVAGPDAVPAATAQLASTAKAQPDPVLNSVGTELADKVNALSQTCSGNPTVKSQLASSVQSLVAGKDASALTSFYQATQSASLTPQQTQIAKEVGNLASAYVVQRNFSGLDGSQTDVANIVNSLRKGEITPALPSLKNVAQNASLTPAQKDLIGSVAQKYAPGLTTAAGTLQQGLESLRGLGK